jgi:hypothetical protein
MSALRWILLRNSIDILQWSVPRILAIHFFRFAVKRYGIDL